MIPQNTTETSRNVQKQNVFFVVMSHLSPIYRFRVPGTLHEPHGAHWRVHLPRSSGGECEYGEFVRKIIDLSSVSSVSSVLSTCSLCLYGLLILREILRVVLGLCICASLRLYLVLKLWDLRKTNNCMNFRARPFRSAAWRSQRLVSKLLLESKYCPIASSKWIEWLGDFVLAAMCSGTAHCRQAACDVTSASNRPNCWCLSSNNDNAMTMRLIFYFSTSAAGVTTPFNSVIEFPILGIAQFLWLGKVTVGMKSSFPWILQNRSVKAFDFSQSSFSSL